MFSRAQQIRLKRAQAEAALPDAEYRAALGIISALVNCTSSKDPRLTDRHWDQLLAYFEAIFWRRVDAGELRPSPKPSATFRRRGYWAGKNLRGKTSRDRYAARAIEMEVRSLEEDLQADGCAQCYLRAIQNRMRQGGAPFSLVKYAAALRRTLSARRGRVGGRVECPF